MTKPRHRCENCKHWVTFDETKGEGECARCESQSGRQCDPASLAHASDYEGYEAHFYTSESFGCVQWAPKS